MKRKIKFPLFMKDDIPVRTLEDFQENFDMSKMLEYYLNGKLVEWLRIRYYDELSDAVAALDRNDADLSKKLCDILDVTYSETDIAVSSVQDKLDKQKKIREITGNKEVVENYNSVAFNQKDFESLLNDRNTAVIYLYGENFKVPFVDRAVTIKGLNKPLLDLMGKYRPFFIEAGYNFENVNFVKQSFIEEYKVGSVFKFGRYKDVPLEWILLKKENNTALAITREVIERMCFGNGNDWENSTLSHWLNYEFYNLAFDSDEKEQMLKINMTDNVSLLTREEVDSFRVEDMKGKQAAYIDEPEIGYEEQNGKYGFYPRLYATWWTKTPFHKGNRFVYVTQTNGLIDNTNNIKYDSYSGVRPVILLNTDI